MSMICPNSCPASTGVVLGNDPPHPGFYAVSAKFAKLQSVLKSSRGGGRHGLLLFRSGCIKPYGIGDDESHELFIGRIQPDVFQLPSERINREAREKASQGSVQEGAGQGLDAAIKSRSTSSPWDSAVEDCWHKRVPSSGSTQTGPISSMTLIVCMVQLAPSQQLVR